MVFDETRHERLHTEIPILPMLIVHTTFVLVSLTCRPSQKSSNEAGHKLTNSFTSTGKVPVGVLAQVNSETRVLCCRLAPLPFAYLLVFMLVFSFVIN